ncbi:hypothetical protein GCM10023317_39880 [Actinopolymorpha pittospori]
MPWGVVTLEDWGEIRLHRPVGTSGLLERPEPDRRLGPQAMVTALGDTTAQARKLVDVGLWEPTSDGYRVIAWDDAQSTRQEVHQRRGAACDRMRRVRGASPALTATFGAKFARTTRAEAGV